MKTQSEILMEYNKLDLEFVQMANDARIKMMEIEMHYLLMENRKNKINKLKEKIYENNS